MIRRTKRTGRAPELMFQSEALCQLLAAILNREPHHGPRIRPNPTDDCAHCRALRATTFRCTNCGYVGAPFVWGCECFLDHQSSIEYWRRERARALAEGPRVANGECLDFAYCDGHLAVEEALNVRHCRVGSGECSHGSVGCPVCSEFGDGEGAKGAYDHAWAIVHDVRVTLLAAGARI